MNRIRCWEQHQTWKPNGSWMPWATNHGKPPTAPRSHVRHTHTHIHTPKVGTPTLGGSHCITKSTSGISRPLEATSVVTRTGNLPSRNPLRVISRCFWGMSPWRTCTHIITAHTHTLLKALLMPTIYMGEGRSWFYVPGIPVWELSWELVHWPRPWCCRRPWCVHDYHCIPARYKERQTTYKWEEMCLAGSRERHILKMVYVGIRSTTHFNLTTTVDPPLSKSSFIWILVVPNPRLSELHS